MADYLPTTTKYFDTLLGEQLLEGEGGGGGSSDFSTAILSIVDGGGHRINLDVAILNERDFSAGGFTEWTQTGDLTVILYKGAALLELETLDNVSINVSGAIENVATNTYAITGDCTMTIGGDK